MNLLIYCEHTTLIACSTRSEYFCTCQLRPELQRCRKGNGSATPGYAPCTVSTYVRVALPEAAINYASAETTPKRMAAAG